MKNFLITIMLLFILLVVPSYSQNYITTATIKARSGLYLRESCSTKSKKIITIPFNSRIKVISKEKADSIDEVSDFWYKVQYKYYLGCVFGGYLGFNNNSSKGLSFQKYNDSYITFEYPKGAKVDVKSGKIYDTKKDTDYEGVASISIEYANKFLSIYVPQFGSGCFPFNYYKDTNQVQWEDDIGQKEELKKLKKRPILKQFSKNKKMYLIGFPDYKSSYIAKKKSRNLFRIGCLLEDGQSLTPEDFNIKIISGKGKLMGSYPEKYINARFDINCSMKNKNDFSQCYELINHFINTVKLKR